MLGRTLTTNVDAAPVVDHSLRFEYSQGDYLTKTLGTPTTSNVWTWSGWVKLNSYTYNNYLFSAGNNTTDEGYIYIHGATKEVRVASRELGTLNVKRYAQALAQDPGEWIHIVVQGSSNSAEMWIDGQQQTSWSTTTTNSTTWSINSAVNHGIGVRVGQSGTGPYLDGQLAEVHFIDGQALTAADFGEANANSQWVPKEVTGLTYGTNGFYLPFDRREEGVTLLVRGDTLTDLSSNPHTLNEFGNTPLYNDTTTKKHNDYGSLSFDGAGDYISIPDDASLDFGSGDFTIECWAYHSGSMGSYTGITGKRATEGNFSPFLLETDNSNPKRMGVLSSAGVSSWNVQMYDTNAFPTDQWVHVAATREGNVFTLWINGVAKVTSTSSHTLMTNTNPVYIGKSVGTVNAASEWNGNIADFRITKGIARDIAAEWTAGTYTSPITNDIQYGSLGRDASTNTNNFTVNGAITPDDQLLDSPNLRFATFDPSAVSQTGLTISEANLQVSNSATNWRGIRSDFSIPENSKAYYEWVNPTGGGSTMVGVTTTVPSSASWYPGADANSWGAFEYTPVTTTQHEQFHNGVAINCQQSGYTIPSYAVAMVAVDRVNGKIHFGIDGLWWTSTSTRGAFNGFTASADFSNLPTTGALYPALGALYNSNISFAGVVNFGQDHTFAGSKSPLSSPFTDSDGNGEFYYEPPAGFRALTTKIVGSDTALQSTGVISLAEHYQTKLPQP